MELIFAYAAGLGAAAAQLSFCHAVSGDRNVAEALARLTGVKPQAIVCMIDTRGCLRLPLLPVEGGGRIVQDKHE